MPHSVKALVKPSLLIWARKKSGIHIDELARRLDISVEKYQGWESGEEALTVAKLRKLAEIYKRPLAVFYLPEPPTTFDTLKDFRLLPNADFLEITPQLRVEIERIQYRREVAMELDAKLGVQRPDFPQIPHTLSRPDEFARKVRDLIGVTADRQFRWKDSAAALKGWIAALEDFGVLIFQISKVAIEEMRGLAINQWPIPVIGLNGADTPNGRIFSLIHEFIHLLVGEAGLCNMHEVSHGSTREENLEIFCNRVAGAVLIPEDLLLSEDIVRSHESSQEWSDLEIVKLSRRFSVSREAILRRLLIVGKTSPDFYQEQRAKYLKEYQQAEDKGDIIVHPDKIAKRNLGNAFLRLVFSAYYKELINVSNLSDYLGIKLPQIWRIEKEVA